MSFKILTPSQEMEMIIHQNLGNTMMDDMDGWRQTNPGYMGRDTQYQDLGRGGHFLDRENRKLNSGIGNRMGEEHQRWREERLLTSYQRWQANLDARFKTVPEPTMPKISVYNGELNLDISAKLLGLGLLPKPTTSQIHVYDEEAIKNVSDKLLGIGLPPKPTIPLIPAVDLSDLSILTPNYIERKHLLKPGDLLLGNSWVDSCLTPGLLDRSNRDQLKWSKPSVDDDVPDWKRYTQERMVKPVSTVNVGLNLGNRYSSVPDLTDNSESAYDIFKKAQEQLLAKVGLPGRSVTDFLPSITDESVPLWKSIKQERYKPKPSVDLSDSSTHVIRPNYVHKPEPLVDVNELLYASCGVTKPTVDFVDPIETYLPNYRKSVGVSSSNDDEPVLSLRDRLLNQGLLLNPTRSQISDVDLSDLSTCRTIPDYVYKPELIMPQIPVDDMEPVVPIGNRFMNYVTPGLEPSCKPRVIVSELNTNLEILGKGFWPSFDVIAKPLYIAPEPVEEEPVLTAFSTCMQEPVYEPRSIKKPKKYHTSEPTPRIEPVRFDCDQNADSEQLVSVDDILSGKVTLSTKKSKTDKFSTCMQEPTVYNPGPVEEELVLTAFSTCMQEPVYDPEPVEEEPVLTAFSTCMQEPVYEPKHDIKEFVKKYNQEHNPEPTPRIEPVRFDCDQNADSEQLVSVDDILSGKVTLSTKRSKTPKKKEERYIIGQDVTDVIMKYNQEN